MQITSATGAPSEFARHRIEAAPNGMVQPAGRTDASTSARAVGDGMDRMSVRDARTGQRILFGAGDRSADDAYRNGGTVLDFMRDVLGRDSIDGAGMLVQFTVHDDTQPGNASWDGAGISFGIDDSDFRSMERALDVVAHELAHGVNEHTNGLRYRGQSGALDESFGDVLGEAVQIWQENGRTADWGSADAARRHDWSSGEDAAAGPFDAISDLARPDRDGVYAKQPGHMRDYKQMVADNGGVHVNSGIPNKAAYEAAVRIGTEQMIKVWYEAFSTRLERNSQFSDAVAATVDAARTLYGESTSSAVRDAWKAVGL